MSKADDIFFKEFGTIIGALVVFAIAMYFIANSIHNREVSRTGASPSAIAARIAPVADVRIGEPGTVAAAEKMPAATAAPTMTASAELSGEQVYQSVCMACHASGAAGAPKLDDADAWKTRLAAGKEALYASVIKGKGVMPAKGGNPSLSDDAIKAAVDYMLAAPAAAQAGPTAAAPAQAAAPASQAEPAPSADKMASAATPQTQGSALPPEADGEAGQAVYQRACLACHLAGVANAPKLGDKSAWEARLQNGVGGLLQSVIKGKGVMPARGGQPALSDADLANSIRYMLREMGLSAE